jgi:hypothetical protein
LSNSYTHVAFTFDAATSKNAERIRRWFGLRDVYVEVEQDNHILILTSESAEVELLTDLLRRAMQTMPDIPSPQGFEWSFSADKHRIGDFGGGAVVIRREPGPLKAIDTAAWLKEELSHA